MAWLGDALRCPWSRWIITHIYHGTGRVVVERWAGGVLVSRGCWEVPGL